MPNVHSFTNKMDVLTQPQHALGRHRECSGDRIRNWKTMMIPIHTNDGK